MLHKTLATKATTTTDQGQFTAIAAAYTVDRVKDRIIPGAFKATIERWRASGKNIPLHWDHKGGPENIIGHIDPARMEERPNQGLYVEGAVNLEGSEKAREVWRLVKANTMALSFGYLTPKQRKASGGINDLLEIDVFEFTIAPHPVNPDTRFLSLKSEDEQREQAERVEREANDTQVSEAPETELSAVGKALKSLKPQDTTPERVAGALDGVGDPDAHLYVRVVTGDEIAGVQEGHVKAVWSTAYVNNLPDGAFLHIEPGGKKDSEGKTTPRSLRHFPVKDADGNIDMPHLRNALARIPQSNLPQSVKDACTRRAQRMLDQMKSVEGAGDGHSRFVDPLRERADTVALEYASGGISQQKPPKHKAVPRPEPALSEAELRKRCHEQMLAYISEDIT